MRLPAVSSTTMECPVQVAVRIRPLLSSDRFNEVVCVHSIHQHEILVGNESSFHVNYSVPMNWTQEQIFEFTMGPRIDYLIHGCNVSVISFGQTNSGKSYTLFGPGLHCAFSETEYGIIPRSVREIYSRVARLSDRKFDISVTFVEICNERIRDLLNVNQCQRVIDVIENSDGSVILSGVEEVVCHSVSEIFSWLHVGMNNRQSRSTVERSSGLSHAVFTLTLNQRIVKNGVAQRVCSKIQFVDLGGSERGFGLNHYAWTCGFNLDSGLVALNNMVTMLVESPCNYSTHMQSVLTRILKDSFGGSTDTLVICCVSPASLDYNETLKTLQFAARVSCIRNFLKTHIYLEEVVYRANEHNKDMESHISDTSSDSFGLEFAASQWLKLVADAEGLFSDLVKSGSISKAEKEKIENWLCLKQECDECVGSENDFTEKTFEDRVLERIDELTESDDKSRIIHSEATSPVSDISGSLDYDNESDKEICPDFPEVLNKHIDVFKNMTDSIVRNSKTDCVSINAEHDSDLKNIEHDALRQENNLHSATEEIVIETPVQILPVSEHFALKGRRKSVFSNVDIQGLISKSNHSDTEFPFKNVQISDEEVVENLNSGNLTIMPNDLIAKCDINSLNGGVVEDISIDRNALSESTSDVIPAQNIFKEFKSLAKESEAKHCRMHQIMINLQGDQKKIEELQQTIQVKEQFIDDINQYKSVRSSVRHRCHRKKHKFEEQYQKAQSNLAEIENDFQKLNHVDELSEEKLYYKQEVEKYMNLVKHYENRLNDIDIIRRVAGDSSKKMIELENSLLASRRHVDKIKKHLRKEEEEKTFLERELIEDQKKLKELELSLQVSLQKSFPEKQVKEKLSWIQEEEEKIFEMREESLRFQEQLHQQKAILDKREAFLKETLCLGKFRSASLADASERMLCIEHKSASLGKTNDKSSSLDKINDMEEKESLRHEIRNLRRARNHLAEQLCTYRKIKGMDGSEERKFLECDEAVEVIDTVIEYKNVLICKGRESLCQPGYKTEECEKLIFEKLANLPSEEMCTLLYKYFQKVIDLRLSGRKMEVELEELDKLCNAQAWKICALNNILQQTRLEADRQIVLLQKENQEKVHAMLRHIGEESSNGSTAEAANRQYLSTEVNVYEQENKQLKKKLSEMKKIAQTTAHVHSDSVSPVRIPQHNLKQLQERDGSRSRASGAAGSSSPTTKVTREKNKLIIQQQKSRRLWKR